MKHAARVALLLLAAAIASAENTAPQRPELSVSQLERQTFDAVNQQRTHAKLKSLQWDDRLMRVARAHSEDMVRRHFFDHVNPDGDDPSARGRRAGYDCRRAIGGGRYREGLGENLFAEPRFSRVQIRGTLRTYDWNSPGDIVREVVDGWMHSPGHRRNILETAYASSAVGIAISADRVYVTQLFC